MTKVAPATHDRATIPGYSIAPNKVTRDGSLSRDARLLFVVLDGRQGSSGRTRVRLDTLATDLDASERSIRRWLDELRHAGLVHTQQTGRSLVFTVLNDQRRTVTPDRPRSTRADTGGHSERTQVAAPLSNNPRELINNNKTQPSEPHPAPSGDVDEYLKEINKATGVTLKGSREVLADLADIKAQGLAPNEAAVLVAAYAATQRNLRNPAGFIRWTLTDLAAGNRPHQMELPIQPTPPPTYAEQMSGEPCQHGDPRGESRCALCRHETVGAR